MRFHVDVFSLVSFSLFTSFPGVNRCCQYQTTLRQKISKISSLRQRSTRSNHVSMWWGYVCDQFVYTTRVTRVWMDMCRWISTYPHARTHTQNNTLLMHDTPHNTHTNWVPINNAHYTHTLHTTNTTGNVTPLPRCFALTHSFPRARALSLTLRCAHIRESDTKRKERDKIHASKKYHSHRHSSRCRSFFARRPGFRHLLRCRILKQCVVFSRAFLMGLSMHIL